MVVAVLLKSRNDHAEEALSSTLGLDSHLSTWGVVGGEFEKLAPSSEAACFVRVLRLALGGLFFAN